MQSSIHSTPQNIAVLGAGVEGLSAKTYLTKHGHNVTVFEEKDGKTIPDLKEYHLIVRSPSIKPDHPRLIDAQLRNQHITSVINLFFEIASTKNIIGVTGTKGKGTTSTMIYEILKADGRDAYLGGNIGTPPLDFIDSLTPTSWVVLELSSFQLMDSRYSPHIAVIVMTVSEHLDWHKDMKEYWDAKSAITKYQKSDDVVIFNDMFEGSKFIASFSKGEHIAYDLKHPPTSTPIKLTIPGKHNLSNAYAAYLATKKAGVEEKIILQSLSLFKGLPHRLELVGEIEGVTYYNDSISTIPETTIAAIQSFDQPKILILGGATKHSDFTPLAAEIGKNKSIKTIIGLGPEWQRIKEKLNMIDVKNIQIIEDLPTLQDAVKKAKELAQDGDVVLLSPACTSFDAFKNYKDRGDQFKKAVLSLHSSS